MSWARVAAGGAVWAVTYNAVWGVAWFAFMRREWFDAMTAVKRSVPWTPEVWVLWVALTLPIGAAIVAYAAGPARSAPPAKSATLASLPLWLLMTLGMAGWGWGESLPFRVLALDSVVNLAAMVAAAFAGAWLIRSQRRAAPAAASANGG